MFRISPTFAKKQPIFELDTLRYSGTSGRTLILSLPSTYSRHAKILALVALLIKITVRLNSMIDQAKVRHAKVFRFLNVLHHKLHEKWQRKSSNSSTGSDGSEARRTHTAREFHSRRSFNVPRHFKTRPWVESVRALPVPYELICC